MKLILILLGVSLILMGCYSPRILTLMPRDTGKTYTGTMISTGNGVGNITITIDQITYSGPVVRVGSNETFGFATAFGSNSRGTSASSIGSSFSDGDQFGKAILSSIGGKGLRCDMSGRYSSGGGICVDDEKRIYDVIFVVQ
jgi:hypothetical protein